MGDEVFVDGGVLTGLADAIRGKTGKSEKMYPREMAGEVESVDISEAEAADAAWINRTLESPKFPEGVTEIHAYMFSNYGRLNVKALPDTVRKIGDHSFSGCVSLALERLPEALEELGPGAFYGCSRLAIKRIPASCKRINSYVTAIFNSCASLTEITFESKPEYYQDGYSGGMFAGCNNLTVINVPWAEGELAGAPWGARNATVNYNFGEADDGGGQAQ